MSLADFMKQLQEQESGGIVYSDPPEHPVKVIPPTHASIKLIPPEDKPVVDKPFTIKIKIDRKEYLVNSHANSTSNSSQAATTAPQPVVVAPTQQVEQPVEYQPVQQPVQQPVPQPVTQPVVKTKEELEEELFIKSRCESSKRDRWMEIYHKALESKKQNEVANRLRAGRFVVTPEDDVIILPDYDAINKDPDDIIKDSWL